MFVRDDGACLAVLMRAEKTVWWVRTVFIGLTAGASVLFRPAHPALAVLVVSLLVGLNAYVWAVLAQPVGGERLGRLGRGAVMVDAVAAVLAYATFFPDARAIPVGLLPFVVFELTLRYGLRGAAAGLALFGAGLAVRVWAQAAVLEGGSIRPPLILVWSALAVLMAAVAGQIRAYQEDCRSAASERERMAQGIRALLGEVLTRSGVSMEDHAVAEVLEALRDMEREGAGAAPGVARRMAELLAGPDDLGLSSREREILALLAQGYSAKRIASLLYLSPSTVRNHIHNIKVKLNASSRDELIVIARERRVSG